MEKKSEMIAVRVTKSQKAKIEELAKRERRSISQTVEFAIEQYVKEQLENGENARKSANV